MSPCVLGVCLVFFVLITTRNALNFFGEEGKTVASVKRRRKFFQPFHYTKSGVLSDEKKSQKILQVGILGKSMISEEVGLYEFSATKTKRQADISHFNSNHFFF